MTAFDKLRVVVADDDKHMRALLTALLRNMGIVRVSAADNAASALELVRRVRPDLLLTDVTMGDMTGIELVQNLRQSGDDHERHLPVIMITGHAERTFVEAARDAGVNEFLAKPVSLSVLQLRIAEVIMKPRSFVETNAFVGPDRRRRANLDIRGRRRRKVDRSTA